MPNITDSKCVLVLGATAGLGRALALAIHALPSKPVIVGGRRKERLEGLVQSHAGEGRLKAVQIDVGADRNTLQAFAANMIASYPDLDTIMISSGIQRMFDFTKPEQIDLDEAVSEMNINYISIFTLITFFLPHLLKLGSQGRPAFIIPLSSNLGVSPNPGTPNYCATKAALHNLCMSLQAQLRETNVHVIEIMPNLVESELHDFEGTTERLSKIWMPLDEFTIIAMDGLKRGDPFVLPGNSAELFNTFEKGKMERVFEASNRIKALFQA